MSKSNLHIKFDRIYIKHLTHFTFTDIWFDHWYHNKGIILSVNPK